MLASAQPPALQEEPSQAPQFRLEAHADVCGGNSQMCVGFLCFFRLLNRSHDSLDWPKTHSVTQAALELLFSPVPGSQVRGLQACATTSVLKYQFLEL